MKFKKDEKVVSESASFIQFNDENKTIIDLSLVAFVRENSDQIVIGLNTFSGLQTLSLKGIDLKELKKILKV